MIDLLSLFFMLTALESLWTYSEAEEQAYFWCSALAAGILASARVFTVAYACIFAVLGMGIVWQKQRTLQSVVRATSSLSDDRRRGLYSMGT